MLLMLFISVHAINVLKHMMRLIFKCKLSMCLIFQAHTQHDLYDLKLMLSIRLNYEITNIRPNQIKSSTHTGLDFLQKKNTRRQISHARAPLSFFFILFSIQCGSNRITNRNIGYVMLFVVPLLWDGRFMCSRDTIRLQMYCLLHINRFTPPPPHSTLPPLRRPSADYSQRHSEN